MLDLEEATGEFRERVLSVILGRKVKVEKPHAFEESIDLRNRFCRQFFGDDSVFVLHKSWG